MSVDTLAPPEKARYFDLAVFAEDTPIPPAALEALWAAPDFRPHDVAGLLDLFVDRSLAQRDDQGRIRLHDLQYDYICNAAVRTAAAAPVRGELDNQLLAAYARTCDGDWPRGPDDGYFFQHLADHLLAAGQPTELRELLFNLDWLQAQINATDPNTLIGDCEKTAAAFRSAVPAGDAERSLLELLAGALRLSAHVLAKDKTQLAAQLRGRLLSCEDPLIRALVAQTAAPPLPAGTPALLPLHPTLTPSGGPLLRTLEGHSGCVTSCVVLPDGRRALSGSDDKTLKLWDLESGACLRTLEGHSGWVRSCVVLPDGRRALSGSGDKTLKLWDLESGACLRTLEGHSSYVSSCVVLPDGRRALSGSDDKTLKLWDLDSGACLRTLEGHSNWVRSCVVLPDGRRALSGSWDNTLKLWDLESGACLRTLEGHSREVTSCVVLPDGRRALSCSDDKTLKLWDLESGACPRTVEGHSRDVNSCVVLPDGRRALSGSDDQTLKLWDLESGACLRTLEGHSRWVRSCVVLPDGRRALSGSGDKTLKLWDLESGACLRTLERHSGGVNTCVVLPDGRRGLSGSWDQTLKLWDLETGACLRTLEGHTRGVASCVVLPDGRRALSGSDDQTLKLWDLESGACLRTLRGHSDWVRSCVVLPDGRRALSGSGDKTLKLWDLQTGACLRTLERHSFWVTSCVVLPEARRALSGSHDDTLKLWDLESGACLRTLRGHDFPVTSCVVLPDGQRALSGSEDQTLKLWDLESGACLRTLEGHSHMVTSCVVLPDGRRALSGSGDNTLKLWDLASGTCLATFTTEAGIGSCAVAPDGVHIVAGDDAGHVHFLELRQVLEHAPRDRVRPQPQPPPTPPAPRASTPAGLATSQPREPSAMPKKHVFLSYCRENLAEVQHLHDDLVAAGEPVWWDQDIAGGEDWKLAIRRAMKDAYAVVLCLSAESQARTKSGIYPEARDAIKAYREYPPGTVFLIPVRLSACAIPDVEIDDNRTLDGLHYIDLFPEDQRARGLGSLLTSIRRTPEHPLIDRNDEAHAAPARDADGPATLPRGRRAAPTSASSLPQLARHVAKRLRDKCAQGDFLAQTAAHWAFAGHCLGELINSGLLSEPQYVELRARLRPACTPPGAPQEDARHRFISFVGLARQMLEFGAAALPGGPHTSIGLAIDPDWLRSAMLGFATWLEIRAADMPE